MTETSFKIGDKIAAAVLSYKRADLRVGVIEKIHPPTGSINVERYTIRDDQGYTHVVSSSRAVRVEADKHHTMAELYDYRMVYNAFTARHFSEYGKAVKSWKHYDGEVPFGEPFGTWFIVGVLTPEGWVTNHYKGEFWDLFDIEEHPRGPKWDGHTPAEGLARLRNMLENPPATASAL